MDEKTKQILKEVLKNAETDQHDIEWKQLTPPDSRGNTKPKRHLDNVEVLLEHFGLTVRYNEMSKRVEIDGINRDQYHKDTELNDKLMIIKSYAAEVGYSTAEIDQYVTSVASKNGFHPARDWILSKEWDGKSRFPEILKAIVTDHPLKELYVKRWMITAVEAAFSETGVRNMGMLTFTGKQGLGKTRFLESLVPDPDWVDDGVELDPRNKDSVLQCVSKWIVELGEIQATFRRSDIEALKGFITKKSDIVRPAYAAKANEYVRRTVFFGTVDTPEFLNDKQGSRRFWVLDVDKLNVAHGIDIQQLWAEMYAMWKNGERSWMDQREISYVMEANKDYMSGDPIEEILETKVQFGPTTSGGEWLNCTEILHRVGITKPTKTDRNTAGSWLRNQRYDHFEADGTPPGERPIPFQKNTRRFFVNIKSNY